MLADILGHAVQIRVIQWTVDSQPGCSRSVWNLGIVVDGEQLIALFVHAP